MKNFYAILCIVIASLTQLHAQAPQGFNYQATVRNSAGDLIVNTNVYFKFNVIQGSQTAVPIFTETHYVPTDDLGQVNLVIGQGTANTGIFSELDWSLGSYYLGIELDTGNGYVAMGTTQLLSVPYALYAENSRNAPSITPNLETVLAENNSANNQQIKNLQDPTDGADAVTKSYADALSSSQGLMNFKGLDNYQVWTDGTSVQLTPNSFVFVNANDTTLIFPDSPENCCSGDVIYVYVMDGDPLTPVVFNLQANGFPVAFGGGDIPIEFTSSDTITGWFNSVGLKTIVNIGDYWMVADFQGQIITDSDVDNDGDGFTENQGDCDDNNATIYPPVIPNHEITICSGQLFVFDPVNNPPTTRVPEGTTYTWTVSDNFNEIYGESSTNSNQSRISQTLTNYGGVVYGISYEVTPYSPSGCEGQTFELIVYVGLFNGIDTPLDVSACDSYTLPALTNGNYFTATNGGGTALNAGDAISTTTTLYVYAETDTAPICYDEHSFTITINSTPAIDKPVDVSACDSYTLPALTNGNYFTAPLGGGTALNAGDAISTTTTLYVYAEMGTTPNCNEDHAFTITIITTAVISSIDDVVLMNGEYRGMDIGYYNTDNNATVTYDWVSDIDFGAGLSGEGDTLDFLATNSSTSPITGIVSVSATVTYNGISCVVPTETFNVTVCAEEIEDGIDNDCDGDIDEGFDVDGDGYSVSQGDCDDNEANVYPAAPEIEDGIDNNCDGIIDEFIDPRDNNIYKTIVVNGNVWLAEDLRFNSENSHNPFYDDPVAGVYSDVRMYWPDDYDAIPEGWRIPTKEEWVALFNFVGGFKDNSSNAYFHAGGKLKSNNPEDWSSDCLDSNIPGTNEVNFNAVSYSFRTLGASGSNTNSTDCNFDGRNQGVGWWSSTENSSFGPNKYWYYYIHLNNNYDGVTYSCSIDGDCDKILEYIGESKLGNSSDSEHSGRRMLRLIKNQ